MTSAQTLPDFGDAYEVERELGRGGMATVYLAHDRRHGRRVAVKVLRPELASSIGAERFVREVRIVAALVHPHILPLHDSGVADGAPFYVMPFVEGETLRERLVRGGPLAVDEALRYANELADALAYAHERGVVHRDVKPENVLLSAGHALLTDFGVAHALQEAGAERLTATGVALGTPAYMSPEQASGEPTIDGRSDVFSLGTVIYEMLSGRSPFSASTLGGTLARVLTDEPAPVTQQRPDAPREVGIVLARALAKDPGRRFPTARALGESLAAIQRSKPAAASRGRRAVLATASLLLLGAASVGAWLVTRPGTSSVPSLAVLPFANETGDTSNAYFGAGIADELLTALTDVPGLRVASRTSSFSLAANPDARATARGLGVGAVLTGSVRRDGPTMRVTATLYDAARDSTLWTKRFDRPAADVFAVQEDIARAIVTDLRVRLAAGEVLVRRRTVNTDAHDLVLRAHAAFTTDSPQGSIAAVDLLNRAEALDSSYAEIYALRSRVYQSLAIFRDQTQLPNEPGLTAGEMLRRARVAAARAVALDSLSASAHLELGRQLFRYDWDWPGAEREIRRARALNGTSPEVYQAYARFLRSMRRFDEARAMLDTAVRLEGGVWSSPDGGEGQGRISYFAGEFERAVRETRADTVSAQRSRTHASFLAGALLVAGRYAEAESLLGDPRTHDSAKYADIALLYARTGRLAEARAALERYRRSPEYAPTLGAGVYAALGEPNQAIAEIERAIVMRDPLVVDLAVDPRLDAIRNDPRFQQILIRLRFPR